MESTIKLVERFIAGVTKPARFSIPEAETNPHQYDGPRRTAEQVAAQVRHPRRRSGLFFYSRTAAWLFQPQPLPKRVWFLRHVS